MKVYICTDHDTVYPVGGASVIIATDEEEAREILDAQLIRKRVRAYQQKPYTLTKVPMTRKAAYILNDGNY